MKLPPPEELRPFRGSWVVCKDDKVLTSGPSISSVVNYLRRNKVTGTAMFWVPLNPEEDLHCEH